MRPLRLVSPVVLSLVASAAFAQTVNIVGGIGGPENAGHVTATVRLSAASSNTVTVDYATVDDTAKAGTDYQATSGKLMFNPGDTVKTVDVTIYDNNIADGARQFVFTISNPTGGATLGSFTAIYAVITDDDPPPHIDVSGNTVAEGDGTRTVQLTMTLVGQIRQTAMVSLQCIILPSDPVSYSELNGLNISAPKQSVTFNPGDTVKYFDITITGNNTYDGAPSHTWTLQWQPLYVDISETPFTLVEDDPIPNVTVNNVTVTEGTSPAYTHAHVTFTADRPVNGDIDFTPRDGTATSADYAVPTGTNHVTFRGTTSATADVLIVADGEPEPNETFFLDFVSVKRMNLDRSSVMVTIVDDDGPAAAARVDFSPSVLSLYAGQTATVTATLSPAPASDLPLQLQASSPSLVVPASITIPPAGSASFHVTAMAADSVMLSATPPPGSNVAVGSTSVDVQNPTITQLNPLSVAAGVASEVTIRGTGFSGACHVAFDRVAAPTRQLSDTGLAATAPARAAGTADVTVVCAAATIQAPQPLRFVAARRRSAGH